MFLFHIGLSHFCDEKVERKLQKYCLTMGQRRIVEDKMDCFLYTALQNLVLFFDDYSNQAHTLHQCFLFGFTSKATHTL